MDISREIAFEFRPFIRIYKDGRIHRFGGTERVSASMSGPNGVSSRDVVVNSDNGCFVRLFLPKLSSKTNKKIPVVVYFHGGGFFIDSPASTIYHPYCNSLAAHAEALVISVDYRLAPEHRLPTAYDDAWAALNWISTASDPWIREHADFDRLYFAGDSAGANIAHNMAVRLRKEMESSSSGSAFLKIKGIVLMHAYFWGSKAVGKESRDPHYRRGFEEIWAFICPSGPSSDNPLLNPFVPEMKTAMATLPCEKLMVCVAEMDVFRERGKTYYESLKSNGWNGKVELVETKGKGHVFYLFNPACKEAHDLMKKVVEFVRS